MAKIQNIQKPFNYRLLTLIIASCFGIIFSIPSFFQDSKAFANMKKITLGLDLQGGISLLLDIDMQVAMNNKYTSLLSEIKFQTDKSKIFINGLRVQDIANSEYKKIVFTLLDSKAQDSLDKILANIDGIEIAKHTLNYEIVLSEKEIREFKKYALEQSVNTIRDRLDKFGLSEPSVLREGENQIRVEMPGVKTQEEQKRLIDLVSQSAKLEFMAVDEVLAQRMASGEEITDSEAAKYNSVLLPYQEGGEGARIPLKSVPILEGSSIVDSGTTLENGFPAVTFRLDSKGADIFGDFTGKNINKRLAIVLDRKVLSAPNIRGRIGGGNGSITGNFTNESARLLSIALRSGALLAPAHVIEKRSVGPSLGADSIKASLIALVSGFILVVGFMILYYAVAGVFAVIALVINLFLIIAIMALFEATLTLPGMAGIVLTVGIAVDANIIINERIREALRQGMGVVKSLQVGYENASRAIFDANITSLIASALLYVYGTGVIKGFAITTGIGILASIITAIIGTHGIYMWLGPRIEKSKNIPLWFGIKL